MLLAGKSVMSADEPMQKIDIVYFANAIRNPREELLTEVKRLRMLRTIDPKRYNQLKRNLPYITCGIFSPPFRRTENFAWIQHFIIDIDHLSQKGFDAISLKQKLAADTRIVLMFVSPGNDGLKIVFCLNDKCYDHAQYSAFYKLFATAFSRQYALEQVLDTVTSDVSRACFFSYDPDVYLNTSADAVNMKDYINFDNLYEVNQSLRQLEKEITEFGNEPVEPKFESSLSNDVFAEIKQKLNPNIRTKPEKNIFVPEELENMVEKVKNHMAQYQIETVSVESIHYGKKFGFSYKGSKSEINLFYGKRGFRPVISPKNGTNSSLNELCYKILCELFFDNAVF